MTSLLVLGGTFIAGIAGSIAILVRVLFARRISLLRGLMIVIVACLVWHALAWLGLSGTSGFVHRVLFLSVIVPFGFGFGDGTGAALVAITIQSVLAAAFAAAVYWWLRRETREHHAGG